MLFRSVQLLHQQYFFFHQGLPNPNSISNSRTGDGNGVAFIDDFEGSKRVTNPSILRRFWNISSAPIDLQNNQEYDQRNRLKIQSVSLHLVI